ncbi:MAG TPA: NTP transferase domain-containing protein [Phycicoccus sp.]|nr:NTP transferase domain-containing protein [Phycicoccus sp.]
MNQIGVLVPTVVVLAGGEARRFGSDKMLAVHQGRSLLDRLLDAIDPTWPIIAVGPTRPVSRTVTWTREEPPGGGPLAAIAAAGHLLAPHSLAGSEALAHLREREHIVLVVAGDMPWAAPALPQLLDALRAHPEHDAAIALDDEGHLNPLLAAYRLGALTRCLPNPAHGHRATLLLTLPHVEVAVTGDAGRDVDTPADLRDLSD